MKGAVSALLLMTLPAAAEAAGPSRGELLASTCRACHGADARGSPPLPPLAGRRDLRQRFEAWQQEAEAEGEAHLMIRLARALSAADVDALARHFAAQSPP